MFIKIDCVLGDRRFFDTIVCIFAAGGEGTRESVLIPAQAAFAEIIVRQGMSRDAIASAEAVSSLELERSIFDSSETEILSAAFLKAWTYVEFDPMLGMLQACERQSELARCLMTILKLGDRNATSIANSAISLMRKNLSRSRRSGIAVGAISTRRAIAR